MIDLGPDCGCWDDGDMMVCCRVHWHELLENQRLGCPCCFRPSGLKKLWRGEM